MTSRTQTDILARFHAADDWLGFSREVLSEALTADSIRAISPEADVDGWEPQTAEQLEVSAREYLDFATDKILDHRGISAERSIIKLREYAWLLGRDDVVQAMDAVDYPQYGAPKVKAFAAGMAFDWSYAMTPESIAEFDRMSQGLPCVDGCQDGCGQ